MAYTKIVFQNSPSTATPLNAENLNHMDDQIALNDQRLTEIETNGVVNTFNRRRGAVVPESGDYTADMIPYDEENSVGDILGNATSEIDGITVANASGESFALVPTSEGNALATHIFGMSTQNGTPTPSSPVDIVSSKADFRCAGKNLHDVSIQLPRTNATTTAVYNGDGLFTINGTPNADAAQLAGIANGFKLKGLKAGDKIKLSYEVISGSATNLTDSESRNTVLFAYNFPHNFNLAFPNSVTKGDKGESTYTIVADDINANGEIVYDGLQIWMRKSSTFSNLQLAVMLRLDGTDDTFEPYKHTDITTDLTLRAIEVSSTDPYNLVRDGKYYIADTVDWSEDGGYVLTKRIEHIELDGTAYCQMLGDGTTNQRFVILYTTTLGYGVAKAGLESKEMSDHFTFVASGISHDFGDFKMDTSGNLIIYDKTNTLADTTAFNTWLGTNKPHFMYCLATPITETITSEQAQSLLSLKTYDVSTSINAQASPEPTVGLEYAKSQTTAMALIGHNEALIAQEKIRELETAIIELGGN